MKEKNQKAKKTATLFASGVLLLTISNLLVKVIGMMLKVPLTAIIGSDGMGYYTSAYDVYVWLYMISTAGIPVAISLMVSEARSKGNFKETKKIFKVSLITFAIVGIVGMCVLIFGSHMFSSLYNLEYLYLSLIAISPTLLFVCINAVLRGYFQGYQYMNPTAYSELIESLGKLGFGIFFALWAMNIYANSTKDELAANSSAMTILGLTIGVFLGMIFLIVRKITFKEALYNEEFIKEGSQEQTVRSTGKLLTALLLIAIPITLSASMMSFSNMLDGMIISDRLKSLGLDENTRSTIIGAFKTQVTTLFNLPPALIYPISASLVPYISTLRNTGTKEEINNLMNSSIKVACMLSMPCAFGMSVLSKPIIQLLFSMSGNPVSDMAYDTDVLLSVQAFAVIFLALYSITTSFMQAYKIQWFQIISILCGCAVKIGSSFILIGNPSIRILGAPIGTVLEYVTIALVNFIFIAVKIKFVPKILNDMVRPLISSAICAAAAWGTYKLLDGVIGIHSRITVIVAIGVAVIVYVAALLLTRSIDENDMKIIPKGDKIYSKLKGLNLVK